MWFHAGEELQAARRGLIYESAFRVLEGESDGAERQREMGQNILNKRRRSDGGQVGQRRRKEMLEKGGGMKESQKKEG